MLRKQIVCRWHAWFQQIARAGARFSAQQEVWLMRLQNKVCLAKHLNFEIKHTLIRILIDVYTHNLVTIG